VLSAVFVFIASSIIHMALPVHKGDFKKLKNEDAVREAMRTHGVEPGAYMFPRADSMKEMCTPEMVEKLKRGPVGWLTVLPPGGFSIGRSLVWWFVYCLIVGVLVAYIGWHALGAGATYPAAFRITGAAAVLGYAVGHFHDSIWKGARWGTTTQFIVDGVIYGLLTAGTFGWLWPDAR
jgi:hypothetical protein